MNDAPPNPTPTAQDVERLLAILNDPDSPLEDHRAAIKQLVECGWMMPVHPGSGTFIAPPRFVVDTETAARIEAAFASPSSPNDALRALFKKG